MQMTAEEICRHYTQASNKSKDIQVLADLNATDKPSIRAILIDGGVLPPDPPDAQGVRRGPDCCSAGGVGGVRTPFHPRPARAGKPPAGPCRGGGPGLPYRGGDAPPGPPAREKMKLKNRRVDPGGFCILWPSCQYYVKCGGRLLCFP